MTHITATEIQLHLASGFRHSFYQEGLSLVADIYDDSDHDIFGRRSLVFDGKSNLEGYPGQDLIGMSVQATGPFDYFFERERLTGIVVTEIGHETLKSGPLDHASNVQGRRETILTELRFITGLRLYLEFSQKAESGIDELMVLNHLFSHSSLTCRRLRGGFSIWNVQHIASWSNYPRLESHDFTDSAEWLPEFMKRQPVSVESEENAGPGLNYKIPHLRVDR